MTKLTRLIGLCVLLFGLIGCSSNADTTRQTTSQAPSSGPSSTPPSAPSSAPPVAPSSTSSANTPPGCPVTAPNGSVPPNQNPSPLFYGNRVMWTSLWAQGQVVFKPGGPGTVGADGSLSIQWTWWRGTQGKLTIEGRRLDGTAAPLRAVIPDGFGTSGFQPTTLVFPSGGCWQVTGKVGDSSLTFVTLVVRVK